MEIHITSLHFAADHKLTEYIERKTSKLELFYDRIIDTKVYLKLENSGQVRGKIVEMKINVPGDTLVATETNTTFEAAADVAVDNMIRQLIKYKERLRMRP